VAFRSDAMEHSVEFAGQRYQLLERQIGAPPRPEEVQHLREPCSLAITSRHSCSILILRRSGSGPRTGLFGRLGKRRFIPLSSRAGSVDTVIFHKAHISFPIIRTVQADVSISKSSYVSSHHRRDAAQLSDRLVVVAQIASCDGSIRSRSAGGLSGRG
jgi:hypothetical protein